MIATVAIVSLGCPKNTADADLLAAHVRNTGLDVIDDPTQADAVVVNTCGFIRPACEESLDTIMELAELKREGRPRRLLVCGCLSERYRDRLRSELPEADAVFGLVEKDCHEILADLTGGREARAPENAREVPKTPYAYVKISEGCDRSCSFCTIPSIRGAFRSRRSEDIESEVEFLRAHVVREIVLVGQDTAAWGEDLEGRPPLWRLIDRLASRFDAWFRVMYLQPEGVTNELIASIAAHPNVCDYFDIPFQHASESVLRRMRRAGSEDDFLRLLARIREASPDAAIRTSMMVGFPGESAEDFDRLARFVRRAQFDYGGLFLYSREEGTLAAGLPGQVEERIARGRHRMLGDLVDEIGWRRMGRRIGEKLDLLVEGPSGQQEYTSRGRSQSQAPEVDGECLLEGVEAVAGEIVTGRVTGTDGYDMICERL